MLGIFKTKITVEVDLTNVSEEIAYKVLDKYFEVVYTSISNNDIIKPEYVLLKRLDISLPEVFQDKIIQYCEEEVEDYEFFTREKKG